MIFASIINIKPGLRKYVKLQLAPKSNIKVRKERGANRKEKEKFVTELGLRNTKARNKNTY